MNILAQEARKRQAIVELARRKGKSFAARIYGVSLSSVKRRDKRYDGKERSSFMERSLWSKVTRGNIQKMKKCAS